MDDDMDIILRTNVHCGEHPSKLWSLNHNSEATRMDWSTNHHQNALLKISW